MLALSIHCLSLNQEFPYWNFGISSYPAKIKCFLYGTLCVPPDYIYFLFSPSSQFLA
jgi:hypothetical protein